MTETKIEWPMPRYAVPEAKYLHALGVITLNYNAYEHMLFAVFSHHLKRTKVPGSFGEFIFSEFNMQQKTEAISQCFNAYEADPDTLEAIDHLLKHFLWCFEARNTLLHAHGNWNFIEDLPAGSKLPLAKAAKGSITKLNFMYLSLEHLRAIADHIYEGYQYLLNLFAYLSVRDDLLPSSMPEDIANLIPRTLPRKPPIPKKIKLLDHPATGET